MAECKGIYQRVYHETYQSFSLPRVMSRPATSGIYIYIYIQYIYIYVYTLKKKKNVYISITPKWPRVHSPVDLTILTPGESSKIIELNGTCSIAMF